MHLDDLPTPCIRIDAPTVRRNVQRMAAYAKSHGLNLRPHTKTHKSTRLARMQLEHGAVGLTVAKAGEAQVMAGVSDNVLMAYPPADAARARELAELARTKTVRIAVDSQLAVDLLADAARSIGSTIGVFVDLDVGFARTGVQGASEALALAQHVVRASPALRLDGILFFPGHIGGTAEQQEPGLRAVDALLAETLGLWQRSGLEAKIVSGGSTPTAAQSHLVTRMTELRPGTYVFNDMNCVRGGSATLDDCAARIVATVISTAVPGQVVIDAGTKVLTSDRCGPAPDSGFGHIIEYPQAKIAKANEEHGQIDVRTSSRAPKLGERITIVPNHICPCVNLQDVVWWRDGSETVERVPVEARGKVM